MLKQEGASCIFICREHEGNLLMLIQHNGHSTLALPNSTANISPSATPSRQEYLTWLGTTPAEDAQQTITALQSLILDNKPTWLIVDHYALDREWEITLRPYCQKIMVIDDLADRQHDCDLLLDQTFRRNKQDYQLLVPKHCNILVGSYYILLRPEFAQWRNYSLERRTSPQFKCLLITLGGVDKDNVTTDVLDAITNSSLPLDCQITIVLGINAPWLNDIIKKSRNLPWQTEVKINVENMAQLMANSDICIGAAGSTTWERCCLGVPTISLCIASNQRLVNSNLEKAKATISVENANQLKDILPNITYNYRLLTSLSKNSSLITDGYGTKRVVKHLNC